MSADSSPLRVAALAIALIGLILVITQYRDETELFTAGHVLLAIGMVAANLEVFSLGSVFSLVEHTFGISLTGAAFFAAAYLRRKNIINGGDAS